MIQEKYLLDDLQNIIAELYCCGNNTQRLEEVKRRLQSLECKIKDSSSISRDQRNLLMRLIILQKEITSEVNTMKHEQITPSSSVVEHLAPMSSPGTDFKTFLLKTHRAEWCITNFHRERSRKTSKNYIDSEIFNLGTHADSVGYRYCLRAYLNGHKKDKDRHLALHLVIVRGDADDLLIWPFPYSVTISIYKRGGGVFTKTIIPDGSASFQKPTGPFNNPNGFKRFISKEELDDCVNNDTINIVVDIQD